MGGPLLMACCYLWIVCQRPAYVDFFAAWLPLMLIGLSVLGSSSWVPSSRLLIPSAGLEGVLIRLPYPDDLVGPLQSSLVPGHGTTNNALIAQEVIHHMTRLKSERGYENGNFMGPGVLPSYQMSQLTWNVTRYCGGASIFTTSGVAARIEMKKSKEYIGRRTENQTLTLGSLISSQDGPVQLAWVGIKVPISVPLPFSAFISVKLSFAGDVNFDGKYSFINCCRKSRNSVLHPSQDSDSTMERSSEWRFIISAIAKLAVAKLLAIILETAPDLAGRRYRNC
ncbi:hypothetical protein POTOM_005757 [Populus tomentosa]|uniref:Uncharacterized protein n=1 Tax=Populus tomentosa TaxID=118781 RepID=A0A8X8DE54_POPTO|nr:hypothetical protein POTOM_005757 [Populus tomentosa]